MELKTSKINAKKRSQISFTRYVKLEGQGRHVRKWLGEDTDAHFLRKWIESLFVEGMSWENYGSVWVIDHLVPLRCFDIMSDEEMKLCWNYRNLTPLLKDDNLKKQGNVFFAFELLHEMKGKHFIYQKLFDKIIPEVRWMAKYIDNYIKTTKQQYANKTNFI